MLVNKLGVNVLLLLCRLRFCESFQSDNWVAVRRIYVFTLQEVEKICRTLQSHVMQVWTMTFWLLAPDPDKAEPLPVLSNKLPFFSTDALAQIA